ncbi:MAG: hypothetical protein LBH19_00665 [Dysgonamonadaceae bacterium]|jgi:hypothetical protein|nr:hypothetical protein [Dysgonamonadaceae bacterium]
MKYHLENPAIRFAGNCGERAVLLLCGMIFTLTSCDKMDTPVSAPATAKGVRVSVNISGITERPSGELRSADGIRAAQESKIAPLGDGLLLEMTLEPAPEPSALRATVTPLKTGTKILVVALNDQAKYVSHAEFEVGGANTKTDFHMPTGRRYTFICVSSHSKTSLPVAHGLLEGETPSFTAAAGTDLLYGRIDSEVRPGQEDLELSFTLSHKSSEVSLVIDCSYDACSILNINPQGVRLGTNYDAKMLYDGSLSESGSPATHRFFSWNSPMTSGMIQQSLADTAYVGTGDISIVFSRESIETDLRTIPSAEQTITFTGEKLEPGKRYTLRMKVKTPKFADSNIYWDGNKLTFDEYSATPNPDNQKKQGVFFKWGSLIGISGAGTSTVSSWTDWDKVSTPIFIPENPTSSSSSWVMMSALNAYYAQKWPLLAAYWNDIPNVQNINGGSGTNSRYLTAMGTSRFAEYLGDICYFLNRNYRMPTNDELKSYSSGYYYDNFAQNINIPTHESGNTKIEFGLTLKANSIFFPASGCYSAYKNPGNGALSSIGYGCHYWTNTPMNSNNNPDSYVLEAGVILDRMPADRNNAFSVRCIKND